MISSFFVTILCVFVMGSVVESKTRNLPSFVKKCHINEDTLKHCLEENMDILRPYLKKGIPEMKIPALDPLHLPQIAIQLSNFVLNSTDLQIYDWANYKVKSFEINPKDHAMKLTMFYPFLHFAADYTVDGKILLLTLSGSGKSNVNATDVTTVFEMKGLPIKKKNGLTYMDYTNNSVTLNITKAGVSFLDLFQNNKELTTITNRIINDNINEFVKELKPYIEDTVGAFVFEIIRNIFNAFPMEELFIY